jgi:hypothetical protein
LEEDKLFKEGPILQPEAISMMIVIDVDSAPDSDVPVDPQVLKRSKLSATDEAEVGWESLEDWVFENETLPTQIAKLKKKQDGEVDNPPATLINLDLAKEVAAASQVLKAKHSMAVASPVSGTHSSAHDKGAEVEPIMQKAIKHAAAKIGTPLLAPLSQFLAFPLRRICIFWGLRKIVG